MCTRRVHFDMLFEMRSGLVAVMLVACGGKGAVLEIHTKAATVEVWVSAQDCVDTANGSSAPCRPAIAWASAGPTAHAIEIVRAHV